MFADRPSKAMPRLRCKCSKSSNVIEAAIFSLVGSRTCCPNTAISITAQHQFVDGLCQTPGGIQAGQGDQATRELTFAIVRCWPVLLFGKKSSPADIRCKQVEFCG
jgi:hypothetical protein